MLSETLRTKPLFSQQRQARINAPAVLDRAARNLILAMRIYEEHTDMSRERIEECVLRSLEQSEFLYCGLDKDSLMALAEMEIRNDKSRTNNR